MITQHSDNPFFSIIIPSYNAEKTLTICLNAIFNSRNKDFEVIVVDDDSQDNTMKIAESFCCKVLKMEKNQGPAAARNLGAREAKGEVLLFLDSDIEIKNSTLDLIMNSLRKYPIVFGIYCQKSGVDNLLSLFQNFFATKSMQDTKEYTAMFYSYCGAIKKKIFEEVGGFNENWFHATFEDVELGLRITEKGHQIYLNKNIKVTHHNIFTFKKFIKNYFYKSMYLLKFMLTKRKLTLNNEGWTNYKNFISFFAALSLIPSCIGYMYYPLFIIPLLIAILIFLSVNFDFYKFIFKEKPAALIFAIILSFIVQIISAAGMLMGFIGYLKKDF
jgi:glycosyltransferase involved in cell wall biosynthesis